MSDEARETPTPWTPPTCPVHGDEWPAVPVDRKTCVDCGRPVANQPEWDAHEGCGVCGEHLCWTNGECRDGRHADADAWDTARGHEGDYQRGRREGRADALAEVLSLVDASEAECRRLSEWARPMEAAAESLRVVRVGIAAMAKPPAQSTNSTSSGSTTTPE